MRVGQRILRPQTVAWLRAELQRGALTRAALGRGVCEQEQWRNAKGVYCTASARKALPALAQQLGLPLPAAQAGPPRERRGARAAVPVAVPSFRGTLAALGAVQVQLAHSASERQLCASLLSAHHPLGAGRAPGCRLS